MIKSGNIQFNPAAFKDYTFEQFKAEFKGKLAEDAREVFNKIQQALPKDESNSKPSTKSKKH